MGTEMTDDQRITRQPSVNDPQELRIRGLLDGLLTTSQSREMIEKASSLQEEFLRSSLNNSSNTSQVETDYRNLLSNLSEILNSHIVKGEENLAKLTNDRHVIIATNHFGSAKLTRIDANKIGQELPLKEVEPFPIRHAPFKLIEKRLNSKLFECAAELPEPFLTIQKAAGVIRIPAAGENRTEQLIGEIKTVTDKNHKTIIVMYPEGGTSGKRNEGTPYDLDEFHKGMFVAAVKLGIPILPVNQKLNPETGIELNVMEPIRVNEADLANIGSLVQDLKGKMQSELI